MKSKDVIFRKKPKFLRLIPWLSSYTALAFFSRIYVSEKIFNDLNSNNPNPESIAILKHEKTHVRRQKEIGSLKFGFKYFFSPQFRFQEELIAIRESMKHLKKNGIKFDINKSAKFLSSWLYLWAIPYDEAKKKLEKTWNEI